MNVREEPGLTEKELGEMPRQPAAREKEKAECGRRKLELQRQATNFIRSYEWTNSMNFSTLLHSKGKHSVLDAGRQTMIGFVLSFTGCLRTIESTHEE